MASGGREGHNPEGKNEMAQSIPLFFLSVNFFLDEWRAHN